MSKEVIEINSVIQHITQSCVVNVPHYTKYGGYEGNHEIYTADIAMAIYRAGYLRQTEAEWKAKTDYAGYGYYCSNCNAVFTGENAEWIAKEHKYCPKCGAKMKGGAE